MCCSRCSWMENPNNQSSRTAKICSLETQIIANETWKYWMPNGRCFLSPLKFTFKPFVYFNICFVQMLNRSFELCLKTYGEKHMLTLRLYLNIGILYEDNRDFQKAYDYFVKWHETCQEVRELLKWHLIRSEMKGTVALACFKCLVNKAERHSKRCDSSGSAKMREACVESHIMRPDPNLPLFFTSSPVSRRFLPRYVLLIKLTEPLEQATLGRGNIAA